MSHDHAPKGHSPTGRRSTRKAPALLVLGLAATGAAQLSLARPALAQSVELSGNYSTSSATNNPLPTGPVPLLQTLDMTLGVTGQGGLDVESGGTAETFGQVILGQNSGSSGTATVNSTGSSWSISTQNASDPSMLTIGSSGNGTLIIENGGLVNSDNANLGVGTGSLGDVTVTGSGAKWSSGRLEIGEGGTGNVTISSGGWVTTFGDGILGAKAGSTGTVTVSGSTGGLGWTINTSTDVTDSGRGNLIVGDTGTGILTIENNGLVKVESINGAQTIIGNQGGSQGTVAVTGAGSSLKTASEFIVGNSGTGNVTVSDGASLISSSSNNDIGYNAGGVGTVTVTGSGSTWNSGAPQNLTIGNNGTGTLNIEDDAVVGSAGTIIGNGSGSNGMVLVSGTGASGINTLWGVGSLTIGNAGTGQVTIENGGTVAISGTTSIGAQAQGSGTLTVTGDGSSLGQEGTFTIGGQGSGALNIDDGGSVVMSGADSFIGLDNGAAGTVTVTGAGSTWDSNAQIIHVGYNGTGTLNVTDGGNVDAQTISVGGSATLGGNPFATGAMTVTGADATVTATTLALGEGGKGTLTVDDGGEVDAAAVAIGFIDGGTGTINLDSTNGTRGVLETAGITTIGGRGVINFNGGILRASTLASGAMLGDSNTAPLSVNILSGGAYIDSNSRDISLDLGISGVGGLTKLGAGTLTLTGGNSYGGVTDVEDGTLLWGGGLNSGGFVQHGWYVVNGGTLDLGSGHGRDISHPEDFSLTMSALSGSGGTIQLNLADLVLDETQVTTYGGSIIGAGGLTKTGSGDQILSGASTYAGPTTVDDGELIINGSITSTVTTTGSGTLGGTGTVGGDVINDAVVAPGDPHGTANAAGDTLTVGGDYSQGSGGVLRLDADFTTHSIDQLTVNGNAALDGTIDLRATSLLPNVRLAFLTVGGTLSGTVSAPSPIYTYDIRQDGNQLSVAATSAHFDDPGVSLNKGQENIARHLQEIWDAGGGSYGTLFGALGTLAGSNTGAYASALSDLSPAIVGATAANTVAVSQQHLDMLMSCPTFAPGTAFLTETHCSWAQTSGRSLHQKSDDNGAGFDTTTYSMQTGTQFEVAPDWFLDLAGGYDRSYTDSDDNQAKSDGNTFYGGAGVKYLTGPWLFSGALSGSYGHFDNTRKFDIPGFEEKAKSDSSVYDIGARARAAYTLAWGNYYLRPRVDVDLTYTHADGFHESGGGALNLDVNDASQWNLRGTPTLEVGTRIDVSPRTVLRAFATAGVAFSTADHWKTTARLADAPSGVGSFDSTTPLADVVGEVTAGVDLIQDSNLDLRLGYQGMFAGIYTSHAGSLRASYTF